jgi:DNA processing protein
VFLLRFSIVSISIETKKQKQKYIFAVVFSQVIFNFPKVNYFYMSNQEDLKFKIALTLIPKIGTANAKYLLKHCGSAEAIFKESKSALKKIPRIGRFYDGIVNSKSAFKRADEEIDFIRKRDIQVLFYTDNNFPQRLKHCADSPVLLYFKGTCDFNKPRIVGVVGTRNITDYGRMITSKLIEDLYPYNVTIASGMAYGIDICSHRESLNQGITTVGVMAHGLDRIYPDEHYSIAAKMLANGGILTEYMSGTIPDRQNFPTRNRIVAGICDAIVVVEAAVKGGALITADIAQSYNRDVFAFPGNVNAPFSIGCNNFIRDNRAALITSAADLAFQMGWNLHTSVKSNPIQSRLFVELNEDEQQVVNILLAGEIDIDTLAIKGEIPFSKIGAILFSLEMKGVIRAKPGKKFSLL